MATAANHRRTLVFVAFLLWSCALACGYFYGARFEITPGATQAAEATWPAASRLPLASDRATLVMFVHPRCSCSRASLQELLLLLSHCPGNVDAHVVFHRPSSQPLEWAKSDLWASLADVPGVTVHVDSESAEQRLFKSSVSGEVFLYLPTGQLAFHGGVTGRRGHVGENAGRAAIEALVQKREAPTSRTLVFGCDLEPADCSLAANADGSPEAGEK